MPNTKPVGVAYSDPELVSGTTIDSATVTSPAISGATMTGTNTATTLIVSSAAAFFSVTAAITQPSGAAQAAVATTAVASTAGVYGFTTTAQGNAVVTLVNEIRSSLVNLGLIKGS